MGRLYERRGLIAEGASAPDTPNPLASPSILIELGNTQIKHMFPDFNQREVGRTRILLLAIQEGNAVKVARNHFGLTKQKLQK